MHVRRNRRRLTVGVANCLLLIGTAASCGGSDQSGNTDRQWVDWRLDAAEPPRLSHESLPLVEVASSLLDDDPALAVPSRLAVAGEFVVAGDNFTNPALHILHLDGPMAVRWRRSVGRKGQGPGEYASVQDISRSSSDSNAVWIYDLNVSRLTHLGLHPSGKPESILQTLALGGGVGRVWQFPIRLVSLNDTTLVGTTQDSLDASLTFVDKRDGRSSVAGSLVRIADRVPPHIGGWAYPAHVCYNPGAPRIAVAFLTVGRLELRYPDGTLAGDAAVPLPFPLRVDTNLRLQRRQLGGPNERIGYSGCTVTRDLIFGLFSGKLVRAFGPDPAQVESAFVHVFDWTGRFFGVLQLDHEAVAIAIDESGRYLYSSGASPRPSIRVTDIRGSIGQMVAQSRRGTVRP